MITSISSDYFDDKGPEQALELLVGAGWCVLEFSNTHTDHLLERDEPVREAEKFLARSADLGAKFIQSHLPLEPDLGREASPDRDRSIEALKRALDVHLAMGTGYSMHHVGRLGFMEKADSPDRVWDNRIAGLCELLDHVKGTDQIVCVENGIAPSVIDEVLFVIERCERHPNLGVCLDTGHLNLAGGEQGKYIRGAGPLLKCLHIHDNDGTRDQHQFPYTKGGTVRWNEVVPALREIGFGGTFNFEVCESNSPMPIRLAKLDYLRTLAELLLADKHEKNE